MCFKVICSACFRSTIKIYAFGIILASYFKPLLKLPCPKYKILFFLRNWFRRRWMYFGLWLHCNLEEIYRSFRNAYYLYHRCDDGRQYTFTFLTNHVIDRQLFFSLCHLLPMCILCSQVFSTNNLESAGTASVFSVCLFKKYVN